jgi:hypothetical protein
VAGRGRWQALPVRAEVRAYGPGLNHSEEWRAVVAVEEWALIACVVFSGLWSGLLAMLTTVLHPMLRQLQGAEFVHFMRGFLPPARHAPFNYIAVLGMVVAPAVALVGLADEAGGVPFVLVAIGLVLTVAGPLLVSRLAAEPNYDVILGWDPNAMPAGWEAVRERYFALNWTRAAATWAALALFIAALAAYL